MYACWGGSGAHLICGGRRDPDTHGGGSVPIGALWPGPGGSPLAPKGSLPGGGGQQQVWYPCVWPCGAPRRSCAVAQLSSTYRSLLLPPLGRARGAAAIDEPARAATSAGNWGSAPRPARIPSPQRRTAAAQSPEDAGGGRCAWLHWCFAPAVCPTAVNAPPSKGTPHLLRFGLGLRLNPIALC